MLFLQDGTQEEQPSENKEDGNEMSKNPFREIVFWLRFFYFWPQILWIRLTWVLKFNLFEGRASLEGRKKNWKMDSFDSIQNDWIVEIQSMEIYSLLKIFLSASFIFSSSTSFLESILVSSKNLAKNGRAQNFNFLPWDFLQLLLCKIVTYMYTLTHTILTSTHTHTLIQKYTHSHTLIHKQPQTPTH